MAGLTDRQLEGVGAGVDERGDDLAHVFDALQEAGLVEEAMVDGDVEAALGRGVEEAVETILLHEGEEGGTYFSPMMCLRI